MSTLESELNPADLLKAQLEKVGSIRRLDFRHPQFMKWHDTTLMLLKRLLSPDSPHLSRFQNLTFRAPLGAVRPLPFRYRGLRPRPDAGVSPEDKQHFERACEIAAGCISGAVDELVSFGIYVDTGKRNTGRGDSRFQQHFSGPVTIGTQAIATDNAIQNIQHSGDTGINLREVAALLNQSLDLTGRERVEGLKAIETIAIEMEKPERRRDWSSLLESGEKLALIAEKATDLASKFAPHIPTIATLIKHAANRLGG